MDVYGKIYGDSIPIGSMCGIFTYIWLNFMVYISVGKYYIILPYMDCLGYSFIVGNISVKSI